MVSMLTLFGTPLDTDAFDVYFDTTHRQLLADVPRVAQCSIHQVAGAATGPAPFHLVVELQFDTEEAMQGGLNSAEGQEMARDLANFASGGVTVLFTQRTSQIGSDTQ